MRRGRAAEAGLKSAITKSASAASLALFNDRPRFQIVGQRDRAEIVSQRRTHARRRCLHGGNTRAYDDVDAAPARVPIVDCLKNRRRHCENPWIAAGDERDVPAICGQAQGMPRAFQFGAVARSVALLP